MIVTVRILQWIAGLAGLAAMIFGVLDWVQAQRWVLNINYVYPRLLLDFTLALGLFILSLLMFFTPRHKIWGMIGIIYALVVALFGSTQDGLLAGSLHWLIRVVYLLIDTAAILLVVSIANRYLDLKGERRLTYE